MKNQDNNIRIAALKAAFPCTLPVMAGYGFLGLTYGIYMHALGFSFLYPMLMACFIYAGAVEFIVANMLTGAFHPLQAFMMALMVNARHLFYGLAMLDRYKGMGWKKFFLIFGLSDETFAMTSSAEPPKGIDRSWFLLWITWLDETYWVIGATAGGLVGSAIHYNLKGLDFVLTAMFVTIFADNWLRERNHTSSLAGLVITGMCLMLFGSEHFIIPAMVLILVVLTMMRGYLEKGGRL